ncbi:MAG: TetR/AcrR family transcriptional regulator [Actinobacteria bacterium]|nr:TetR/AcrR family transcriptional regulator [Actinomycetota bacterium]
MAVRTQREQTDVRQRILEAALHDFSLKGYHRATLDEIAAEAGVSKGAVYWYFENKRALFLAVVQEEASRLTKYLEGVVAQEGQSVVTRLEAFIVANLTYYTDHPEFCNLVKIFTLPGGPGLDQDVEAMASDEYRRLREMVEALLRKGVRRGELEPGRAKVAAPMLVALLDGLMFQWILDPEAVPLQKIATDVARAFIEGVVKQTPRTI